MASEQADELLSQHRAWFAKRFQAGNFLLLGPYLDKDNAGVIIAQAENREQLDNILQEDVYYPQGLATYQIREFKANMLAENIHIFVEK
ncbi:MAG: YciI family protein [Neisseria sp.]|nr:YciI family protein [Neisseria sp.]MDO4640261.1 YciI family protein [Neisseria sp.]